MQIYYHIKYIIHKTTLIHMANAQYPQAQMPSQEKTSSTNSKLKKITCLHCALLHMRRDLREITDVLGAA